jgi:hypothetical protein
VESVIIAEMDRRFPMYPKDIPAMGIKRDCPLTKSMKSGARAALRIKMENHYNQHGNLDPWDKVST